MLLSWRSNTVRSAPAVVVHIVCQGLVLALIIGAVYRYCWIDLADPYKCSALLNQGEWLDSTAENPFQNWQAPGCLIHEYKQHDIRRCFDQQRLVFVGDSTTRQIFWAIAKKLDEETADEYITDMLDMDLTHKDLEFESAGVTVQFKWDPWLNSTALADELKDYRPDAHFDKRGSNNNAGLILLGAPGLWYARYGAENYFKDYKDAIDSVIPYMDHVVGESMMLPNSSAPSIRESAPNLLLFAPVQTPWYASLSPSRAQTMTPEKIDQMNQYLQQVSAYSMADVVWSFSLMSWASADEYEESGIHVIESVANHKADVLLNLRCNAKAVSDGFPFDRTCCSNYSSPNTIQWGAIIMSLLAIPGIWLAKKSHTRVGPFLPPPEVSRATVALTLVACYCFFTDRTQLFEKGHKQFRIAQFLFSCLVAIAVGTISIRRTKAQPSHREPATFLSRDQTEEWKGWMQIVILIYHYMHGSQILWLYKGVRILVASYLFMTGFGHTLYFLEKDDFTLKRVSAVLIRLNLVTCILAYMMRTNYLFYYFAPLVSFWFMVVYLTLKIGHQKNYMTNFVLTKIMISAPIVVFFTQVPFFFDSIALCLKFLCGISWDMAGWRFRLSLDLYIVYLGMMTALIYQRTLQLKAASFIPLTSVDRLIQVTINHARSLKPSLIILFIFLLTCFYGFNRRLQSKQEYNEWHAYLSWIPVLALVAIRNSSQTFTSYYSAAFAWVGRCSLETYVLQYHIWLAGDTYGILQVGLWSSWIETSIFTLVFLWVSHCTGDATKVLTAWIVGFEGVSAREKGAAIDSDDEDDEMQSPQLGLLSNESRTSKEFGDNAGLMPTNGLVSKMLMRLKESLCWRLGCLLLVMWVANITST